AGGRLPGRGGGAPDRRARRRQDRLRARPRARVGRRPRGGREPDLRPAHCLPGPADAPPRRPLSAARRRRRARARPRGAAGRRGRPRDRVGGAAPGCALAERAACEPAARGRRPAHDPDRGGGVRRALLLLAALGLAACPAPASRSGKAAAGARSAGAGNRLNVLLVTIDTLRADHLGAYGYARATSPKIDALAGRGVLFEQAYTYWPKTRGSFVALLTGRLAAQSGYGKSHPRLLDFNATLASVLHDAGYDTTAVVDNPNVAASLGYSKGFVRYRETWEEAALASEVDRSRAITRDAVSYLRAASRDHPFLLWLHYVNPHAPYEPPAP